jgi:predicted GNAT superfamily acetyltransferase
MPQAATDRIFDRSGEPYGAPLNANLSATWILAGHDTSGTAMSIPREISICTRQDYNQILDELHEFWGARDTRHLHHPFLIHEFGNSAFVIRNGGEVVAYLFGFLSQTEPVGYVHTVAVRMSARRRGLAQQLFGHFVEFARRHGCKQVKAITTPSNLESIAFHKSLGMQLLGDPTSDGIPVVPDYAGRGAHRVVFWKAI